MKKLAILFSILLLISNHIIKAQTHEDSVKVELNALRDDYISKIEKLGFKPRLKIPPIVLDNPRSFGNYDDTLNVIHTCNWNTLPQDGKDFFNGFAQHLGQGLTGEKFFRLAVYKWIFIHELSHWWRACQQQTADPYENEKAANRIDAAYWHDKEPEFYQFMLLVFNDVLKNTPNPVPAGQQKEKYLNDNYQKLPGGSAYTWYQSIIIVEVSKEVPFETFKQAVENSGKPLK
jgi:hypothetical protein